MLVTEVRNEIVAALKEAAKLSNVHPEMLNELNCIEHGANPRDIIGVRWCDLISNRYDQLPLATRIAHFNTLA